MRRSDLFFSGDPVQVASDTAKPSSAGVGTYLSATRTVLSGTRTMLSYARTALALFGLAWGTLEFSSAPYRGLFAVLLCVLAIAHVVNGLVVRFETRNAALFALRVSDAPTQQLHVEAGCSQLTTVLLWGFLLLIFLGVVVYMLAVELPRSFTPVQLTP